MKQYKAFLLLPIKIIKPCYESTCEYRMNTVKQQHEAAWCQQKEKSKASHGCYQRTEVTWRDAGHGNASMICPFCCTNMQFPEKGKVSWTRIDPCLKPAADSSQDWSWQPRAPTQPPAPNRNYTSVFCRLSTLHHLHSSRVFVFCPLPIMKLCI